MQSQQHVQPQNSLRQQQRQNNQGKCKAPNPAVPQKNRFQKGKGKARVHVATHMADMVSMVIDISNSDSDQMVKGLTQQVVDLRTFDPEEERLDWGDGSDGEQPIAKIPRISSDSFRGRVL